MAFDFDQMLIDNAGFLVPFAVKLTRDTDAARDLFQETLYRALANKDKHIAGTNIKAWLYTIMRNIFINQYRRKVKQKACFNCISDNLWIHPNYDTIDNVAESGIMTKDIQKSIHDLPDIFRYPFLLYCEGYKYHEIGEILDMPLGTVKSRIHFARKILKAQIQRQEALFAEQTI